MATSNAASFQRRIAGGLPIQVEVPRTGNSYSFVLPLVIDEETKVMFQDKRKWAVGSGSKNFLVLHVQAFFTADCGLPTADYLI